MAFLEYSAVVFLLFIFIFLGVFLSKPQKRRSFTHQNWPVIGTIQAIFANTHRIYDFATAVLIRNGGTFRFKGPWFANMDMVVTADPSDINHILCRNFHNYPKGNGFRKIFDILGDGIFSSDGELWEIHRKTTMSILKHSSFQDLLEMTVWKKVEKGLLPVLESISTQGMEVDLQEIFKKFTFDIICELILDYNPQSLSVDFPCIPLDKELSDTEEAIFYRYITPVLLWKLQKLFRIGKEKKMSDAWKTTDQFIYKCLDANENKKDEKSGLLADFMRGFDGQTGTSGDPRKFLRDTLLTLVAAGRDTTSTSLSWFFYLLAINPMVQDKIREEIQSHLDVKLGEKWRLFQAKELGKLVYLHAASMEVLRLYPPVPFNHKTPQQPDILPSGHHVDKNTKVILSFYSMGRMKSIWGEDCKKFKPERWLSEGGGIKHVPSYKFPAFNAGPRTCLGKDMGLYELKIVATTIIHHYNIKLVEDHPVVPSDSIVLQMKFGLKVNLTKRSVK